MGIVLSFIRVAPDTLNSIRGNDRAVAAFVYGDPSLAPGIGFLARLFGKKEVVVEVPSRREGDELDLDKCWDLLNFLLTGNDKRVDQPLSLIGRKWTKLCTLANVLDQPMEVDETSVANFAHSLSSVNDDSLMSNFDIETMKKAKLYFADYLENDENEVRIDLIAFISEMREFFNLASASNEAMIMYYS